MDDKALKERIENLEKLVLKQGNTIIFLERELKRVVDAMEQLVNVVTYHLFYKGAE